MSVARAVLFGTLSLPNATDEVDFARRLLEATRTIPRYEDIWHHVRDLPAERVPQEVFGLLRRSADPETPQGKQDGPIDGVFVSSIKETGALECAGRTLIASDILTRRGVQHCVARAAGHVFVVYEVDSETLGYLDANNNLHFTFPREALRGYKGANDVAECHLENFVPGKNDIVDGFGNSAFVDFYAVPPNQGLAASYFANVRAALHGHPEFVRSAIPRDLEAAEALVQLEEHALGPPHPALEERDKNLADAHRNAAQKKERDIQQLLKLRIMHPNRAAFVAAAVTALAGELGSEFPYAQAQTDKRRIAELLWSAVSDARRLNALRGRLEH